MYGYSQEGLFEIIIRLSRNIIVLQIFFAMEGDGFSLDLALFYVDLVSAENDGDVFADPDEITWENDQLDIAPGW